MPAWIPIIKASLPYLTQIVTTAIPVFTRPPKEDDVLGKQIAELQTAVTQNAESLQVMAGNLQETIQGIDLAAQTLQAQMASLKKLAYGAMAVAVASLTVALIAIAR